MKPTDKEDVTSDTRIKDVWIENLFEEMENIASLVYKYNYISMVSDTTNFRTLLKNFQIMLLIN